MRIVILVEGATETAFMGPLREHLARRLAGRMPRLVPYAYDGRIPKGAKLQRVVNDLLSRAPRADAVIALTDVYTGTGDFESADDANRKMRTWVGDEPRFFPHVALHDFEAWLLPYWDEIQRLAKHNGAAPARNPETVNHAKPPAVRLKELFERGACARSYVKPRDAGRILRGKDLQVAINQCAELRAFVRTIESLAGGESD